MILNELNGLTLANVQCCIHEITINRNNLYTVCNSIYQHTPQIVFLWIDLSVNILQSQVYVNDQFISIKYALYSFEQQGYLRT